jgi:hypothetical protein
MFNVKDYIVVSQMAKEVADNLSILRLEKTVGPYEIYNIDYENNYVTVPKYEPLALDSAAWKKDFYEWFTSGDTSVPIALSDDARFRSHITSIPSVMPLEYMIPVANDCHINTTLTDEKISFTTDCVGKPHIISVSYFPNWQVEGADKIYLVSPSFMLVYPTQSNVTLRYGDTPVNYAADVLTLAGLIFIIYRAFRSQKIRSFLKR